jgi:hypothetical protein
MHISKWRIRVRNRMQYPTFSFAAGLVFVRRNNELPLPIDCLSGFSRAQNEREVGRRVVSMSRKRYLEDRLPSMIFMLLLLLLLPPPR